MKAHLCVGLAIVVLAVSSVGFLCGAQPQHAAASARDNDHPTYALGPGDEVTISVLDLDDIGKDPYRIDVYGNLTLPLLGPIHVAGSCFEIR